MSCSSKASPSSAASTTRGEPWARSRASRSWRSKNTTTKSARRLLDENLELLRKSGHHYRAANALEIAARLAAAQDRDRRAARLYGAASVFRGSMGAGMFECEVWPDPAPHIARLRSVLGEPAFAETWAQGTAMTLDQSLAYAMKEETASDLIPPLSAQRWS